MAEKKKNFLEKLLDKVDEKLVEKSKKGCCCCEGKKEKDKCCE